MDILSSIEPVFSLLCVYYIKSFVAKLFDVSLYLYLGKVAPQRFKPQKLYCKMNFGVVISMFKSRFVLDSQFTSYYFQNQMVWIWLRNCFFYNQFQCFSIHAFGWLEVWQSVWKLQVIIFSCPGQLNRWPCHSLSGWVIHWLLISASSKICRAVVDTCNLSDNWSEG